MKTLIKPIEKPLQAACKRPTKAVHGKRKMGREEAKYWGLWSEIWNKFKVPASEQPQWRRELRREVLGSERTQSTFTHGDYDVILGAMRELLAQAKLVVFPEKIIWAYMEGEARRIAKLIDNLQMPPAYIVAISRDKFGTNDWRSLLACEMMHLFYTCNARNESAKKRGKPLYNKDSQPQPITDSGYIEADPDDFPF